VTGFEIASDRKQPFAFPGFLWGGDGESPGEGGNGNDWWRMKQMVACRTSQKPPSL
jgi:hypothetical protein